MFKLALSPTFWAPVKVEFVNEDGKTQVGTFRARWKRHDKDQVEAIRAKLKEGVDDDSALDFNEQFVRDNCVEIGDLEITDDGEGNSIASGDTKLLLDFLIRKGMTAALVKSFTDTAPKARAKN